MKQFTVVVVLAVALVAGMPSGVVAGWDDGHKQYVEHQFDSAIETCKNGKDVPSRLVTALSYVERYNIYKDKNDSEQAKIYLNILKVDVNLEDIDTLEKFLGVPGNANGNKEADKLLEIVFKNAKTTPEHMLKMARFLDPVKGDDVNKTALAALAKRLAPVREYVVNDGGTMPEDMQKLFANTALIDPLVVSLGNEKTASGAKKCLTLIEEPALKTLEAKELTKPISDTIVSIKNAIAKRQKKFPESTWFSASGQ